MTYADTDFFLALLKDSDWLQSGAKRLYSEHQGRLWTSPATLIELLLLAKEYGLDPERLLVDAVEIAELRGGDLNMFLTAAGLVSGKRVGVFDALHAASCGPDEDIISSDKVFDRLGMRRIPLEEDAAA